MLLFSPPARHFVIPRVLPSFYHGVSGHCVISCMEKSQTFSRNGATGRGKLRERPEKIAPLPFFVSFSPKWSMIRGSYQTDIKRRLAWAEKIGHATNRKISAQNRAHKNRKRNNFDYVKKMTYRMVQGVGCVPYGGSNRFYRRVMRVFLQQK